MDGERLFAGELRAEGRRLSGTVMRYGDVSPSHRERFESRALLPVDHCLLCVQHDESRAIAWTGGGGLDLEDDGSELRMVAELPPLPLAEAALAMIREGEVDGLSVYFRAREERREGGLRVVSKALLRHVAIVKHPSYRDSRVEARERRRMPVWL